MLDYKPMVIERRKWIGGLQNDSPYLNPWMPVLPTGATGQDVAAAMHATMKEHDISLELNTEAVAVHRQGQDIFRIETASEEFAGRFLVIASGVRAAPGGLHAATNVLIGPGQQIAAGSFQGRHIAILGGGDDAFENYLFIRQRGVTSVTIFARALRARSEFLKQAPPEDIHIGECRVREEAATVNGRKYDSLIVLYGWEACLPYMESCHVAINDRGFVVTGEKCETSQPGIYAIGEVAQRTHPCCITSMADGVVAAKEIQWKLEQNSVARFVGISKGGAGES